MPTQPAPSRRHPAAADLAPDPALDAPLGQRVAALRAFNRFYTQRLGVLRDGLLDSRFSLPESRLLWELAQAGAGTTASALARTLDLDPGYLSRLLRRLRERGLVKARRSSQDGRQALLQLSAAGWRAFAPLDQASRRAVTALLAPLAEAEQTDLLQAAARLRTHLGGGGSALQLRAHRPGDIGWIVMRHGALYAQEYGWDSRFESLVARIAADFLDRFDRAREACWIAERDGLALGCVCLVQSRDEATQAPQPGIAQLRLLLVEPAARGLGVGRRLVAECEAFARAAGYQRIRLWTNSLLGAARHLYVQGGYQLLASEAHHSFGHDLVGETWELALT